MQKCETTESGAGTGIVARVTVVDGSLGRAAAHERHDSAHGARCRCVSSRPRRRASAWRGLRRPTTRASPGTASTVARAASPRRTRRRRRSTASRVARRTNSASTRTTPPGTGPRAQTSPRRHRRAQTPKRRRFRPTSSSAREPGTSIALSWAASTDDVGVVALRPLPAGRTRLDDIGNHGHRDRTVLRDELHARRRCVDAAGNRSEQAVVMVSTTACGDTQPPTAPTGLAASSVTQTSLTLRWAAATDNVGVTGYNVYRNGTLLGQTSDADVSDLRAAVWDVVDLPESHSASRRRHAAIHSRRLRRTGLATSSVTRRRTLTLRQVGASVQHQRQRLRLDATLASSRH